MNWKIEQLEKYVGRLIEHTCNKIGCKECPFTDPCEVNRVQDEIDELKEKEESREE